MEESIPWKINEFSPVKVTIFSCKEAPERIISSPRCESMRVLKFEIQHFRSQKDCGCSRNGSPENTNKQGVLSEDQT